MSLAFTRWTNTRVCVQAAQEGAAAQEALRLREALSQARQQAAAAQQEAGAARRGEADGKERVRRLEQE